jgi:hydroxylamine reductase (hybrid-cluster protein)
MAGMSPEVVYNYLTGIHYPTRKPELIEHAKNNGAGGDVIGALETLPDEEYKSQDDLIRIGSQLKHKEWSEIRHEHGR